MVIFHSYVSLPEGTNVDHNGNLSWMQMGTLRGYSINNPRMISKGLLANATLAQDPKQAAKVCVPLPCFETLENCHAVH